jgi:hypothetical protein
MELTREHFARPRPRQHIHLFWDRGEVEAIEVFVRQAAAALGCHYALLPGETIPDGATVREQLGALYAFPDHQPGSAETWDGLVDWLSDLTWLTDNPVAGASVSGFLLLYRHPARLFSADTYSFAVLLDVLGDNAERLGSDVPFHVILGPIEGDRRMGTFIELLRVSACFCPLCRYP